MDTVLVAITLIITDFLKCSHRLFRRLISLLFIFLVTVIAIVRTNLETKIFLVSVIS